MTDRTATARKRRERAKHRAAGLALVQEWVPADKVPDLKARAAELRGDRPARKKPA